MEKITGRELEKQLTWRFPNIGREAPDQTEEASEFCEGYKEFLDLAKTEREFVSQALKLVKNAGYKEFVPGRTYKAGDKVFVNNRGKAMILTTFGEKRADEGLKINAAHIDSPRLDLKPNPLYEKHETALFKTHYYGGIRKYQWATIPLALHGVVVKKGGEIVEVCVGEDENDPVFCVTDLLPHLAAEQNKRTLAEGIKGEELNILVGSLPFVCDEDEKKKIKEPVKLLALKLLNDKYGMTEKDFIRAEFEMVPAVKARDVGFDRSMVGAYGQDDRVCAYTALMAELETCIPERTTVTVLADKEEIGSEGNTGLNSDFLFHHIQYLAQAAGVDYKEVLRTSVCLSSDVNAAFDPTFPQVSEERNNCFLNKGCVLTKYTGARGKSGTNDAGAELVSRIIDIFEENGVYWQTGELGAVDAGGGGTVAKFVAGLNVDVVDLGVPVLSMHAPFEVTAKLDIFNTYKAYKAFYK